MKKIVLKSLSLINFKGVREFTANFSESGTVICGDNGTGKTTLYDAYLWLLFGKDSAGRGDGNGGFQVKTLGPDNKPIYRLEHSVTAIIEVDGKRMKLQRSLVEKWTKKNGSNEETMNDETQFYINDVRCGTKKEYQAEISEIITEDMFRMITNPFYFLSLSPEIQKEFILDLAGNITDDEVAATVPEFEALLDMANGTSLVKLAQEISAKKRACADALKTLPAGIETAQKIMPEKENWVELEKELAQKKKSLSDIDKQIADQLQAVNIANERKSSLIKELGNKRIALANRKSALTIQATKDHNTALADIQSMESELSRTQRNIEDKKRELADVTARVEKAHNDAENLRDEYRAIAKEKYVEPDKTLLVCPTCGEPLKGDNLDSKLESLRGNFEQDKAKRLKAIQTKGIPLAQSENDGKALMARLTGQIATLEDKVLELKGKIEYAKNHIPEANDVEALIAKDPECVALNNDIEELTNRVDAEIEPADVKELQEAKTMLNDNIAELNKLLGKRDIIARCEREISELEEKIISNNQEITDCERWENIYTSFLKARDAKLMERINGLFKYVSFSFLKEQKNGGEKITCICMVNGVPYATNLNTAARVNAGLDIINALCMAKGISAPIFIDNRESINELLPTFSQVINLCVSQDQQLTVKQ